MIFLIRVLAKKILAALTALASLFSGVCWMSSANAQMTAIGASPAAAEALTRYSASLNQSAAVAAMFAGCFIAMALCVDD
ncbi:hypothetical protein V2K54_20835 [Pseudomonas alliivorans]|nr:hypothetical protein [Pseudomonas alliivorans]MEE4650917.1 hypothetical protein [Pseudomonas alliivorans]MEE4733573.1 hypothetical protein [Pseudomonas alliivorans]MEE4745295.1 hypothetical protein [Pseudomonas alliivorans]MEE4956802.1 hypothetical protein [Pseudomonas alliivorans]